MLQDIDPETSRLLETSGFDRAHFERLTKSFVAGELSAERNFVSGKLEAPEAEDIRPLPEPGSAEHKKLEERGTRAIAEGQVGCVVLAGGMATRFGGVVKAAVPVVHDRTFLELKLADIRKAAERAGGKVRVLLMSSFATHKALVEMAEREQSDRLHVEVFQQMIALRLQPDGSVFIDDKGKASPYAPGHGDMTFALRERGALKRFSDAGGRVLAMSNVDNLGATLDPAVIGAHLEYGKDMTIEVVRRTPKEPGGAPARLDGRLQIIEDFRFPASFDKASIPFFNTNTFVLNARAIDRDFPLTWFVVRKKVGGAEVIQFEHLVGELSAHLSSVALEVPRESNIGRFQPVKDPEELELRKPAIEAILTARGVLGG
jgi:UTP--glucose-1-phosphate uridylyltransferase